MSQLSNDAIIAYETNPDIAAYPVKGSTKIYRGSAIGLASGYARPLVAADTFLGFAEETADNSAGADGALTVATKVKGVAQLAVGSAAITDTGASIYASDGATFTKTSASNSLIGTAKSFVSSGVLMVAFKGATV